MDEMQNYEVDDILEYIPYLNRNEWEQCRFNAYMTAQVNSRKKLDIKDIVKFKWDQVEEKDIEISNKDIERLKQISININGNN